MTVRYGAKALELEKGKTSIIVPNKDQLVATLDIVVAGVKAGELIASTPIVGKWIHI